MMNDTSQAATATLEWLARLGAAEPPALLQAPLPIGGDGHATTAAALAALAAEALARDRRLLIITPDDELLPDVSNALDLALRPLCLVLPGADYAGRIALRATLSLLKSRLARDGEDAQGPAWRAQRARLAQQASAWHSCLEWVGRPHDRDSWPADITAIFPVRIAPRRIAEALLGGAVDWAVVVQPVLGQQLAEPWPGAATTLLLQGLPSGPAALVTVDEEARLRVELELLTQELSELELELATAHAEIGDFTRRYHGQVGTRMAELDALQAEIAFRQAAAEPANPERRQAAREAQVQAERSRNESRGFADRQPHTETHAGEGFRPSTDVKKLYRQIAQKIHPDRARDEADRAWRTELMAEANRAYRSGDAAGLQEILDSWQESLAGQARQTRTADARRNTSALAVQVARLKRRVNEIETELNRLYGSRLYELFAAARLARRQGRDLLQEMAERLDGQIAAIKSALGTD